MNDLVRAALGVGMTLLVIGSSMATVNGLVRGWAARRLAESPSDPNAEALLLLF